MCNGDDGMRQDLASLWLTTQTLLISPFCPHVAEHVWSHVLKISTTVLSARWPVLDPPDPVMMRITPYYDKVMSDIRDKVLKFKAKSSSGDEPRSGIEVTVYVAKEYAEWQQATLKEVIRNHEP